MDTLCNDIYISINNKKIKIFNHLCESESTSPILYETMELILLNGYSLSKGNFDLQFKTLCTNKNCHNIYEKIKLFMKYAKKKNIDVVNHSGAHHLWTQNRPSNYDIMNLLVDNGMNSSTIYKTMINKLPYGQYGNNNINPNCYDKMKFGIKTFHKLFHNNKRFRKQIPIDTYVVSIMVISNNYQEFATIYDNQNPPSINSFIDNIIVNYYTNKDMVTTMGNYCYNTLYYEYTHDQTYEFTNLFHIIHNLETKHNFKYNGTIKLLPLIWKNYCDLKFEYIKQCCNIIDIPRKDIYDAILGLISHNQFDNDHVITLWLIDRYTIDKIDIFNIGHAQMESFLENCNTSNSTINKIIKNSVIGNEDKILHRFNKMNFPQNPTELFLQSMGNIFNLLPPKSQYQYLYSTLCDYSTSDKNKYIMSYIFTISGGNYINIMLNHNLSSTASIKLDRNQVKFITHHKFHKKIKKICNRYIFMKEMPTYYTKNLLFLLWTIKNKLISHQMIVILRYKIIPFFLQ